jgi:predicted lipoprotein with Yx(FWY)xxD motif
MVSSIAPTIHRRCWCVVLATGMIGDMMRRVMVAGMILTAGFAVAACGGSSGSSSSSSSVAPAASSAASTATSGAAMGVVVSSEKTAVGTVLVNGQGRTLYVYTPDTSSTSTCTGGCATAWPPLTTQGAPQAQGGVDASKLGTTTRSDGSMQVTYAGHPLYLFATGVARGDLSGQGTGKVWYVVGQNGAMITTVATKPSGTGTSTSSGGGWG